MYAIAVVAAVAAAAAEEMHCFDCADDAVYDAATVFIEDDPSREYQK